MFDSRIPSIETGPGADGSLKLMLWRESLTCGPRVPRGQDLVVWAGHLTDAGVSSALLERCASILRGGSRGPLPAVDVDADGGVSRSTVDVALDDVRGLAERIGQGMTLADQPAAAWSAFPDNPAGIAPDRGYTLPDDMAALADELLAALAATGVEADRRLVASLTALHDLHPRFSWLDYREWRHGSLGTLFAAIALVTLVDFALRTRDLWQSSYGSTTVMRAAAGLGNAGLGAFCSRLGLIARSSADVYDLARVAVAATGDSAPVDAREAWICFLCRECRIDLLFEIIDDLGDIAASRPLARILQHAVERIDVDVRLLWGIRDVAIDTGDWALAIKAQQLVVKFRDQEDQEQVILGSIQASAGDLTAAASTFRALIARDCPGASERLAALRAGAFEPYAIAGGFGSPADRQAVRLHRRGEPPRYPRKRGDRIDAVDVR